MTSPSNINLSDLFQIHWLPNASNEVRSLFESVRNHELINPDKKIIKDKSFIDTSLAIAFSIGAPAENIVNKSEKRASSVKCIERLLDLNVDVNATDRYSWSPLNYAAWFGQVMSLDLLLKYGANPNINQSTLLESIFSSKSHNVISNEIFMTELRIAISSGADIHKDRKQSPSSSSVSWLVSSILLNQFEAAKFFLRTPITDKMFNHLSLNASCEQLCWLELNGVDVYHRMPEGHAFLHDLAIANAEKTKRIIEENLNNDDSCQDSTEKLF